MVNSRNRFPGRRKFLKQSAALSASAATLGVTFAGVAAARPDTPAPEAPPAQPNSPLNPQSPAPHLRNNSPARSKP